jgi:twinkle protein
MTQSKFVKHTPCSNCGSSNANSLYDDGHQWCFSCETYTNADGSIDQTKQEKKTMNKDIQFYDNASSTSIIDRGITSATCIAYGVKQVKDKHFYPYYDADGVMVAVKTRDVPNNSVLQGTLKKLHFSDNRTFLKAVDT